MVRDWICMDWLRRSLLNCIVEKPIEVLVGSHVDAKRDVWPIKLHGGLGADVPVRSVECINSSAKLQA